MPPRRNDPCPCGSGRKYKHCHERLELREKNLRDQLLDYARAFDGGRVWSQAEDAFLGGRSVDEVERGEASTFYSFVVTDHRLSDGRTVLERFAEERRENLGPDDRALLSELRAARWGAYEVVEVRPGHDVRLRDLLTEETFELRDVNLSRGVSRWAILYGRIFPSRGAWVGEGSVLMFSPAERGELLATLKDVGAAPGASDSSAVLSANAARAYRAVANLRDRPPYDHAVTTEGDPIAECRAEYACSSPALTQILRSAKGIYPAGRDRDGRETFNWAIPEDALEEGEAPPRSVRLVTHLTRPGEHSARGERAKLVNLATIWTRPGGLEVETVSVPRLRRAEALLSGLGLELTKRGETNKPMDVHAAWRESSEVGPPPREVPAVEERRIRARLRAEMVRTWPQTHVPALGGRTPEEAARDPEARAEIMALLKDLEYSAAMGRGILSRGDVDQIKRRLGLVDLSW